MTNIKTGTDIAKTTAHTRTRNAYATILNYENMTIKFLPGKHHLIELVDGISRCFLPTQVIPKSSLDPTVMTKNIDVNFLSILSPRISIESILKEQNLDPEVSNIIQLLNNKNLEKIILKDKIYCLKNNLLYVIAKNGHELLVIPKQISKDLVEYLHNFLLHPGAERLKNAIFNAQILLKNRTKLISDITRNCLWCQLSSPEKFKKQTNLEYKIRPGFFPFQETSCDLVDLSYGYGKTYLLTFQCKFTKYLDGVILKTKESEKITRAFILLFTKYNMQQNSSITTDNGTEFINSLVKETLESFGIYHTRITAYNSRASMVERCHKELRSILLSLDTKGVDHKFKIKLAIHLYNGRPQKNLNYSSPNEIFLGFSPTDYLAHLNPKTQPIIGNYTAENIEKGQSKYLNYLREVRNEIAVKNLKNYSNQIINEPQFNVDDLVILVNSRLRLSEIHNDASQGIFLVKTRNLNSYHIVNILTNVTLIRNGRYLRKLHIDDKIAESLKNQNFILKNEHFIEPFLPHEGNSSNLKITNEGALRKPLFTEKSENKVHSKYNLRSRK